VTPLHATTYFRPHSLPGQTLLLLILLCIGVNCSEDLSLLSLQSRFQIVRKVKSTPSRPIIALLVRTIMPGSDKRCTTIDFQHVDSATGNPTMLDCVLGALAPTSRLRSPFAAFDSQQPKENLVQRYSRLCWPTGFLIKLAVYKLGTLWARYPKRYTLRFSIGYTLTGVQQVAKPCNKVLV
jgi:hypothetical protein